MTTFILNYGFNFKQNYIEKFFVQLTRLITSVGYNVKNTQYYTTGYTCHTPGEFFLHCQSVYYLGSHFQKYALHPL